MAKLYLRWQLNPQFMSTDPKERVKLWLGMLDMVKADLKAGIMKDWGMCSDASAGYGFSELSEADLYTALLKWIPYVQFDVKPVLNVDQTIASINKAAQSK